MSVVIRDLQTARGTEHENTTTEGSIAQTAFAANALTKGKVYLFGGTCIVLDNNSTDTATFRLRFGTSTTVTSNTQAAISEAVDVADNDFAVVKGTLEVVSATRAVISGFITGADAALAVNAQPFYAVLTIAADTAYYLDYTADWSVAHADNELASDSWHCIEIAG